MEFDEFDSPEMQRAIAVLSGQETAPLSKPQPKAVVQRFEPATEPAPVPDPMGSMDSRIEQINCYRLLMQESLFIGELSEVAETVQNEVREFILERMQVLLGMRQSKVDAQFDENEVKALKHLAGLTLKAKGIKVSSSPVLVSPKVQTPPPPAPKPQLRLRQVEEPRVESEVRQQSVQSSHPVVATPKESIKKKGRPPKETLGPKNSVKKIKSPKGIMNHDTGEIIYPEIELKEQVKPLPGSGAQPLPMPSLQQVYSQHGQMNNGFQMRGSSNLSGVENQAFLDLAMAATLKK
jgi:hypothetical protein